MGCSICRKVEKGTEEDSVYVCSICISIICSMGRTEARNIVDRLYLEDRVEDAKFVEKIITGGNNSSAEVPALIKRTVPIKLRRRTI